MRISGIGQTTRFSSNPKDTKPENEDRHYFGLFRIRSAEEVKALENKRAAEREANATVKIIDGKPVKIYKGDPRKSY